MRTCDRCRISDWHPEARTCVLADCALRTPRPLPDNDDSTAPRELAVNEPLFHATGDGR